MFLLGSTDVRDVAMCHVLAMEKQYTEEMELKVAINKRYLVVGESFPMMDFYKTLKKAASIKYKKKLPSDRYVPSNLIKFSLAVPGMMNNVGKETKKVLRLYLNNFPKFNVQPSKEELGLVYTSPEVTLKDTIAWLEQYNYCKS